MSQEKVLRITDEERKAIKKFYDRSEKEIEEDIETLKEWIKKQPHLPQEEDETRLRMMLHYNKFSLEKTKNKLDMYYSAKNLVPEFYIDREPLNPQLSKLMDDMILLPLPNLTPDLCRVYLFKFLDKDSTKFNMGTYMKLVFGTMDLRIVADPCVGDYFFLDMEHATLGHIVQFTPLFIKKSYDLMKKSYSDKITGVHFINLPTYANTLVILLNSILSEKLANRVVVHKDTESLRKILSTNVLPNEYGGTAGPLHELYGEWKKYYKSKNDWLKQLGEKKSDESKRIGKPLDSEMFGMSGTFRKLTLD